MQAKIITDHKWHQFKYRNQVPARVLRREFDWLDDSDDYFFKYRGRWYHLDEFEVAPSPLAVLGYDGWHADSYFSGVAIKVNENEGAYMAALVMS